MSERHSLGFDYFFMGSRILYLCFLYFKGMIIGQSCRDRRDVVKLVAIELIFDGLIRPDSPSMCHCNVK